MRFLTRKNIHSNFTCCEFVFQDTHLYSFTFSRYCKVLVQEFGLKVDKGFMLSVFDIFAQQGTDREVSCSSNKYLSHFEMYLFKNYATHVDSVYIQKYQKVVVFLEEIHSCCPTDSILHCVLYLRCTLPVLRPLAIFYSRILLFMNLLSMKVYIAVGYAAVPRHKTPF